MFSAHEYVQTNLFLFQFVCFQYFLLRPHTPGVRTNVA